MARKLLAVAFSIILLFSACAPSTPTPTATFTATSTSTATSTLTFTPTPSSTATPTATSTPVQYQRGRFGTSGSGDYYFDPSLQTSLGTWDGDFFVCTRYFSQEYDSFEIAETNVDCINRNTLGWVSTTLVILGMGYDGDITPMPPDTKQCADGIDNDRDGEIDFPDDPECRSETEDVERATLVATWTPPPLEKLSVSAAPSNLVCAVGDDCPVSVTIRRENQTPNSICVYVQPRETPGQRYYFQFRKDGDVVKGKAFIGPAPDGTKFVIYAVSVPNSSSCPQGNAGVTGLPSGRTGEATITRFKP